ncbi:MAG: hypothetical protein NTW14_10690 [bacterium]|nr:hypothetical protein [bacterium]
MVCKYCQTEIVSPDKIYVSKQATMEGEYHWKCFIEACKNRMPVGIGVIDLPNFEGDDDEPSVERAPASVEE